MQTDGSDPNKLMLIPVEICKVIPTPFFKAASIYWIWDLETLRADVMVYQALIGIALWLFCGKLKP